MNGTVHIKGLAILRTVHIKGLAILRTVHIKGLAILHQDFHDKCV